MLIQFTKMHGLGNDFVLLDERNASFDLSPEQIAKIADRRFGIGCDQILVLEPSSLAGVLGAYRIFNADGSGAEHCGNGVRCVARYLRDAGEVEGDSLTLEVRGVAYELFFMNDGCVRVDMGRPSFVPGDIPISADEPQERYEVVVEEEVCEFGCVSIGNPHATTLVDDVAAARVLSIGSALQDHTFFPDKVNVGFMQLIDRSRVKLRVFERGVGETLACGTGACAAVAIGILWNELNHAVDVELTGGTLHIEWAGRASDSLWMTGPAEPVFEGIIDL
jgi:diaminopimelate epimerase